MKRDRCAVFAIAATATGIAAMAALFIKGRKNAV